MILRCSSKNLRRVLAALTVLGALVALPLGAQAQAQAQEKTAGDTSKTVVRVAVWEIAPFVEKSAEGRYSGFSIDLLNDLSDEAGFDVELVDVESIGEQLAAVREGRVDAAISAISITSGREETVDFSTPMFESGIQAMVSSSSGELEFGAIVSDMFSPILLVVFGLIIGGTLLTGTSVAAWERRRGNEHFTNPGLRGAFDGIWWATITLFTIGYGDMVPRRVLSRLLAMAWIFFGVLMVATITAEVTASLTVERLESRITSVSDLAGRDIVTFPGTTSWDYLRRNGLDPRPLDSVDAAYEEVRSGSADAYVFDAAIIQWLVADRGGVEIAGPVIQPENYGIVTQQGSALTERIDRALLRLREDGTYERLRMSYFG